MRLYDENFGEKFSSYRRIFAQISMWDNHTEYVRFAKIGGFLKNFGRFFEKLI